MSRSGLGRDDRRALAAVAAQFFVNGAIFASYVPRLPEIRDRVDVSLGTLGALLAFAAAAGLAGSATVGALIDRFGSRRVLVAAALGLTAALAVVGSADVVAVLVVGLVGLAVLDVYVDSAMNLQGSWVSARRSTPVMNRLHGLWSLGTVVGGFAATRVAEAGISLTAHLYVVALLMLLVVAAVSRGLLRSDEGADRAEGPGRDEAEADGAAERDGAGDEREAVGGRGSVDPGVAVPSPTDVRRRRVPTVLVLLGLAGACSIAMEQTSSDWAAFRLSDDLGVRVGVAGLAYVAFTAGMTIGRFGGDAAIVRFGREEVFRAAIGLTVVALVVASFAPDRWVVIVAYGVAGLGVATQFPKLYDDAARHRGVTGAGLGALTGGSRVAMLVTPALVGVLADTSLGVGTATAVVTVPAAIAFVVVSRRAGRRPNATR
ncbi:MFS transporter [Ilumatobacter sp.]|uniref:MFS transporter n=1 Tax=Ilumatobacter sp. TaxID=1967498 RepID=UPI003B51C377